MVRSRHSFATNVPYHPEDYMKKLATLAAVAAIVTAAVPAVVIAQGTTQTIAAVDVKMLATGLRAIGMTVTDQTFGYELLKLTISQVAPILPYLFLVLILIFRPKGLLGTRED